MEPVIYESYEHETAFKQKTAQWKCSGDPERYAALYILFSDPNIRSNQEFLFLDDLKVIAAGPDYQDCWITSADRDLMKIAMSIYNGSNEFSVLNLMNQYSPYIMEGLRLFLAMTGYENTAE